MMSRTEHVHQMALFQYGAVLVDQMPTAPFDNVMTASSLKKPPFAGAKATKKALKPDNPASERFGHP